MMNRSSHMPIKITHETRNSQGMLVRTFLLQKTCGMMMLQLISAQYQYRYGPISRLLSIKNS